MNTCTFSIQEAKKKDLQVDLLYWVGCAGSFDERAKNKTLLFSNLLNKCKINFAILGKEEKCTGDVAKRVGNEFLFQSLAFENIKVLKKYDVKKIVTTCPHCFNTLKNEYSELGGNFDVIFYTDLILNLIDDNKLKLDSKKIKGKKITIHDSCYLGRGNGDYNSIRKIIKLLGGELIELKKNKNNSLCCGAGGGQMFISPQKEHKRINEYRLEEIENSKCPYVAVSCPFCNIMLDENVKKNITIIDILDVLV